MSKKAVLPQVVAGRVAGKSQAAIAVELGIGERTVRRWLAEPATMAAVAEAHQDVLLGILAGLAAASAAAVGVLVEEFDSDNALVRQRAAKSLLDLLNAQQAAVNNQQLMILQMQVAAAREQADRDAKGRQ